MKAPAPGMSFTLAAAPLQKFQATSLKPSTNTTVLVLPSLVRSSLPQQAESSLCMEQISKFVPHWVMPTKQEWSTQASTHINGPPSELKSISTPPRLKLKLTTMPSLQLTLRLWLEQMELWENPMALTTGDKSPLEDTSWVYSLALNKSLFEMTTHT